MDYQVLDNFLPENYFKELQNAMIDSALFPWYFNNTIVGIDPNEKNNLDSCQFTHSFWSSEKGAVSDYLYILQPILDKIQPKAIFRIKANLVTRTNEIIEHGFHTDFPPNQQCRTAILYLNSNNGYTIFDNGVKIESLENRFIEFDSRLLHSGTSTSNSNVRVVINFNYLKD
jgi:hypothetical protein